MEDIQFTVSEAVPGDALNALTDGAWPDHALMDPEVLRRHPAGWVCAYDGDRLVGFVDVAWDGATHFFLLDTTVTSSHQRQGIGAALVRHAADPCRARGGDCIHVDHDGHLTAFHTDCGFRPTPAGLIQLHDD